MSSPLRLIDNLLDRVTMYRLLLYYLIGLILVAVVLSMLNVLHFSTSAIIISTLILVIACQVINKILAYIFAAPTNRESALITALILSLIISPFIGGTPESITFLLAASGLAMASKYILAIREKHIFNPAAIAVALTALGPGQSASWWIGTSIMLPFVILGGLLLVRKIHRGNMVLTFFIAATVAATVYTAIGGGNVLSYLGDMMTTSGIFFLGFVMLTEPLTTPPTTKRQLLYAAFVGLLFPHEVHIGSLYSTPELALIAGNIFAYFISPRIKLFPSFLHKNVLTPDTLEFVFEPDLPLKFQPGQYMEWTLPHKPIDSRGDRRFFTLASSPTEEHIRLGIKFYDESSTYKQALMQLSNNSLIVADQIAGDFVLPKDENKKLAFIAGGIGVTPFRSMIQYLIDTNEQRDVVMLYSARNEADIAYKSVFEHARQQLHLQTTYILTGRPNSTSVDNRYALPGRISGAMIKKQIPDWQDRLFYVSGTQVMVKDVKAQLQQLGLPRRQIKVDYFSGYGGS